MIWVLVSVLLAVGAVVPVLLRLPSRSAGARARARSAHARLLHAVETAPGASPAARERLDTCGALLAEAGSRRQYRRAERAAQEGLALLRPPAAPSAARAPRRGRGRTR